MSKSTLFVFCLFFSSFPLNDKSTQLLELHVSKHSLLKAFKQMTNAAVNACRKSHSHLDIKQKFLQCLN